VAGMRIARKEEEESLKVGERKGERGKRDRLFLMMNYTLTQKYTEYPDSKREKKSSQVKEELVELKLTKLPLFII
jgi:hypothetical protein